MMWCVVPVRVAPCVIAPAAVTHPAAAPRPSRPAARRCPPPQVSACLSLPGGTDFVSEVALFDAVSTTDVKISYRAANVEVCVCVLAAELRGGLEPTGRAASSERVLCCCC